MSTSAADKDLTAALGAYAQGDSQALAEVLRLVYTRLRDIAAEQLRGEGPDHTLQPTALVNEAYLRLAGQHTAWRNRSHFFAIAAQAMRRVLIDHARARDSAKRGGGKVAAPLGDVAARATEVAAEVDVLALDEALGELARVDEQCARVVELRFFGGMEVEGIAEYLGVSDRTVRRHWVYAKAWLARKLGLGVGEGV